MFGRNKEKVEFRVEWKRLDGEWVTFYSSRKLSKAIQVLKDKAFDPVATHLWRILQTTGNQGRPTPPNCGGPTVLYTVTRLPDMKTKDDLETI